MCNEKQDQELGRLTRENQESKRAIAEAQKKLSELAQCLRAAAVDLERAAEAVPEIIEAANMPASVSNLPDREAIIKALTKLSELHERRLRLRLELNKIGH